MTHIDTYIQEKQTELEEQWKELKNLNNLDKDPLIWMKNFLEATIRQTARETVEDLLKAETIVIEVLEDDYKKVCLAVNERRVAGLKPTGFARTILSFPTKELLSYTTLLASAKEKGIL